MSETASAASRASARQTPPHEHGWLVESRHSTSAGYVLYVRCAVCGARRVDAQPAEVPPTALSAELRPVV